MPYRLVHYLICTVFLAVLCRAVDTATSVSQSGAAVQFSEITRKEVTIGDHKMTLIRVRPPVLPKAPPPPEPPPLAADQQATEARLAKKAYASLNLTATVYIGKPTVTELRWRDDAGKTEYLAWSNADFRYLAMLPQIETATTVYDWQPMLVLQAYAPGDFPAGQRPPIPTGLNLSATDTDYAIDASVKDLSGQETTLAGLDCLHAYYQVHYAELKAAYEKAKAASDARDRQLRLHPPKTPDTTLRFWIPADK